MSKLSPTMQKALDAAVEHGGLEYRKGGFWTFAGCEVGHSLPGPTGAYQVPKWYVGLTTVRALVDRGRLVVAERTARGHWQRVIPA